jgi:hypothetical protein
MKKLIAIVIGLFMATSVMAQLVVETKDNEVSNKDDVVLSETKSDKTMNTYRNLKERLAMLNREIDQVNDRKAQLQAEKAALKAKLDAVKAAIDALKLK